MAFLPAVIEELVFRGVVLKELRQYGTVLAIFASALLFSFFHLNPAQTFYQFALGVIYATVVIFTGNLLMSMILHFINNFFIITYTFVTGSDYIPFSWSLYTVITGVLLLCLGVAVIWALLRLLDKRGAEKKQAPKYKYKFLSMDNYGYFLCMITAGVVWIMTLLG
jgi:hypothetical protein